MKDLLWCILLKDIPDSCYANVRCILSLFAEMWQAEETMWDVLQDSQGHRLANALQLFGKHHRIIQQTIQSWSLEKIMVNGQQSIFFVLLSTYFLLCLCYWLNGNQQNSKQYNVLGGNENKKKIHNNLGAKCVLQWGVWLSSTNLHI